MQQLVDQKRIETVCRVVDEFKAYLQGTNPSFLDLSPSENEHVTKAKECLQECVYHLERAFNFSVVRAEPNQDYTRILDAVDSQSVWHSFHNPLPADNSTTLMIQNRVDFSNSISMDDGADSVSKPKSDLQQYKLLKVIHDKVGLAFLKLTTNQTISSLRKTVSKFRNAQYFNTANHRTRMFDYYKTLFGKITEQFTNNTEVAEPREGQGKYVMIGMRVLQVLDEDKVDRFRECINKYASAAVKTFAQRHEMFDTLEQLFKIAECVR